MLRIRNKYKGTNGYVLSKRTDKPLGKNFKEIELNDLPDEEYKVTVIKKLI